MYLDESKCKQGEDVEVIFFTLQVIPIPYSFKLSFSCMNNNVEYEAFDPRS